ncbi:hypothetical protein [Rothia koreensis]|jgi:hypothetical protein|nr:hypothetical protein [Rothia koreensis]
MNSQAKNPHYEAPEYDYPVVDDLPVNRPSGTIWQNMIDDIF